MLSAQRERQLTIALFVRLQVSHQRESILLMKWRECFSTALSVVVQMQISLMHNPVCKILALCCLSRLFLITGLLKSQQCSSWWQRRPFSDASSFENLIFELFWTPTLVSENLYSDVPSDEHEQNDHLHRYISFKKLELPRNYLKLALCLQPSSVLQELITSHLRCFTSGSRKNQ